MLKTDMFTFNLSLGQSYLEANEKRNDCGAHMKFRDINKDALKEVDYWQ